MSSRAKRTVLGGIVEDVRGLASAPRDLWIVYAVKLLESVSYFAVVGVLVLYLHDDLRFSDETTGAIFGTWGTIISLMTFVAGFIADAMGQRKALIIAALTLIVGRAMLVASEIPAIPLLGLVIGCWGVASMKPVMTAAVKTHAPPKFRAFAYTVFYVIMNLGAFIAGHVVSWLRVSLLGRALRPGDLFGDAPALAAAADQNALVEELSSSAGGEEAVRSIARVATGGRDLGHWDVADLDRIREGVEASLSGDAIATPPMSLSGYEMIFLVAAALSVVSLLLLRWMSPTSTLVEPGAADTETPPTEGFGPTIKRAARIGRELFTEKTFWAYLLFICVLVLVRAIFVHAHSTWPTYMLREFGEATPQAAIWSLNPLLIIVLTPLIGSLTSRYSAWSVIMWGSFITAGSVLFMAAPGAFEAGARPLLEPLFGDALDYRLAGPVLFVFVMSIGEALWSPRLYEYVAFMAPKGREASYMGLTQLPMFAAKPVVGLMSGWLLATYCPETGERQAGILWTIVFATTLAGPLIALVFAGFIRAAERERRRAQAEDAPTEFE